jgi:hypothetical protein
MKSGLGVGMAMLGIATAVAACEHEAEHATAALAPPAPVYFESAPKAPPLAVAADRPEPAAARETREGRTDRFLWDDRATQDILDGGVDSGMDSGHRDEPPAFSPHEL